MSSIVSSQLRTKRDVKVLARVNSLALPALDGRTSYTLCLLHPLHLPSNKAFLAALWANPNPNSNRMVVIYCSRFDRSSDKSTPGSLLNKQGCRSVSIFLPFPLLFSSPVVYLRY